MPDSVEEFVARENIRQFERELTKAADERERKLLLQMLDRERENLAAAVNPTNLS